jgi:hypothetical protein
MPKLNEEQVDHLLRLKADDINSIYARQVKREGRNDIMLPMSDLQDLTGIQKSSIEYARRKHDIFAVMSINYQGQPMYLMSLNSFCKYFFESNSKQRELDKTENTIKRNTRDLERAGLEVVHQTNAFAKHVVDDMIARYGLKRTITNDNKDRFF